MGSRRHEPARASGHAVVAEHLGLAEASVPALLGLAEAVLGRDRFNRCLGEARGAVLSRRYRAIASIAALTAGTKLLGASWWSTAYLPSPRALTGVVPDEHLRTGASMRRGWPSVLDQLEWWIADAAAEATWGRPAGDVDLNDPHLVDRVEVPPSARPGDRVLTQFDPGGVVDAVIETREAGVLGSRLDLESCRHSAPSEVGWGWAMCLPAPGPFPLPGDVPDPYAAPVDRRRANELRAAGVDLGLDGAALAESWLTSGAVCVSLAALDWPWLAGTGASLTWSRAVEVLIDGGSEATRAG